MLGAFEAKKALIVTLESNQNVYKSARNIEGVSVMPVNNINVYDLLKYEKLIITKDAVSKIEEVYA
jgi:large subunit ribosomal protein L4